MILSEYDRRWAEIRIYRYCMDVYNFRKRSIDISDCLNMVCNFGEIDKTTLKPLVQNMLNDTYYQPSKREIILIGDAKGYSANYLSKYVDMTRQGVTQFINRNRGTFTPIPRCSLENDYLIIKFLTTLDKLRNMGNLGDATTN